MKEVKYTKKEQEAYRLIVCLLNYKDKHGLKETEANWIIRCCGLLRASKSLLRKLGI